MTYSLPALTLGPRSPISWPVIRPWYFDKDCVLALMPEINTKWIDHSGHGNDGTLTGCSKVISRRIGDAVEFEASGEMVTVAGDSSLDSTDYITLEIWIDLLTPTDSYGYAFCKEEGSPWSIYFQGPLAPRKLNFRVATTDKTGNVIVDAIAEGIHHVVGTYDGDQPKLYVDSVLVGTGIDFGGAILDDAGDDINIGNLASGVRDYLGQISEVRIYHRALALWEIKARYDQGKPS